MRGERPAADKMACFEAIRGLAALAVLFFHVLVAFLPGLSAGKGPGGEELPAWLLLLARLLGRFLWDGQMAVLLFFVLSGFVLSLTYWRNGSPSVLGSATVRRYPRLMLPVAASVLLAYVLLLTGAMSNQASWSWSRLTA